MSAVLEIHLVVAYLVALLGLFIGWVPLGRRVMTAVLGIQVLVGIIAAALAGSAHIPLPPAIGVHILLGLLAMFAYIFARRAGERNALTGTMLSGAGFLAILATMYLGLHLTRGL